MVALPLGEEKENYARSIFLVPQLLKTRTNFPTPPCEKRGRVGVARRNFQPRGINYSDGCSPFRASNVLTYDSAPSWRREPFLRGYGLDETFLAWPIYRRSILAPSVEFSISARVLSSRPGNNNSSISIRPRIVGIECVAVMIIQNSVGRINETDLMQM